MPLGPGKYDKLCTLVRERAKAVGVAVIVVRGEKGDGFSLQGPADLTALMPKMLRAMADEIEASFDVPPGPQN